ncbi:MAG: MFS transporter [Rhodospirillaceae bacterium]|nr:MFS transporter [Rhodospirillaceae bacterium]|tara:strand:- start:75278 stop:76495 length:1218 start_codon:yes stop_codon:yes gene_type:complete
MTTRSWRTPVVILTCATLILLLSFGARQTYGLYLAPISKIQGWEIGVFSFAMALQTLIWGLSQPFWGNIADRYGAGRVVSAGLILYAAGLWMMAESTSPLGITLSTGLVTGLGMSATSFPIILAVVGRSVSEKRRSMFLGIASAGGSSGMVIVVPFAQYFISDAGYTAAMIVLAVLMIAIVPLTAAVAGKPQSPEGANVVKQNTKEAIREALGHKGYVLLVTAFFVCGFQTMFVGGHLPNFLDKSGIDAVTASWALSFIGLFNIFGCFVWGALGGRYSKKYMLALLYIFRSITIIIFIMLPVTDTSALIFAAFTGLMFLGTVPLTSGLVAQIFGTQYMAMLYGFAFTSHQVGSFLGIWMGGLVFDLTGSYDVMWWSAIILGFIAAIMHWPIDERPVERPQASAVS